MSGGDAPSPQNLALTVPGAQALQFTIQIDGGSAGTPAPTWLTVRLLKGSTPAQISVAVDQTGLAVQTYSARILVNTSDGHQNIVTVTLMVIGTAAQLDVEPTYLRFTTTPTVPAGGQTLYVRNSGGGGPFSFQATVTAGAPWLTVTPASGQTASNAPVPLQVQVNTQGLAGLGRCAALYSDSVLAAGLGHDSRVAAGPKRRGSDRPRSRRVSYSGLALETATRNSGRCACAECGRRTGQLEGRYRLGRKLALAERCTSGQVAPGAEACYGSMSSRRAGSTLALTMRWCESPIRMR